MNLFIVMFKEIIDNLRDRQTVFYALLFGPVLLPLLLGGSLVASFKQLSINFDEVSTLSVINADNAPNLIKFLYSHNIDVVDAAENAQASVRNGDVAVVLEIGDDYGQALRDAMSTTRH